MTPVERVRNYLKQLDEGLEPVILQEKTDTAAEAARVLKVELGQIVKSILFRCGKNYGLFVAAGDLRVSSRAVKAALGEGKPRVATPEEVEALTGFQVGGVCPYALKSDLPIFIDRSLGRFDVVYSAAGSAYAILPITLEKLQSITGGRLIDISVEE